VGRKHLVVQSFGLHEPLQFFPVGLLELLAQ
jgi:hypothetical protein